MKKVIIVLLALAIVMSLAACGTTSTENGTASTENGTTGTTVITADSADKADIEAALNLANVKPEYAVFVVQQIIQKSCVTAELSGSADLFSKKFEASIHLQSSRVKW